jgi:hypothetical protein
MEPRSPDANVDWSAMSRLAKLVLSLLLGFGALLGLSPTALLAAPALAATAPHPTLLVGELGFEGGASAGLHPTAGTVVVAFNSQPLVLLHKVGRSGQFKLRLAPGTYTVSGCGPSSPGSSNALCGQSQTVTLSAGQVQFIEVVWALTP